jgi:hypothetical protein
MKFCTQVWIFTRLWSFVSRYEFLPVYEVLFPGMIFNLEPILRFLNLQLQRQRCSKLERF